MSNLRDHAIREFRAAGWTDSANNFKDDMQEELCDGLLKLLDVFSEAGHSGSSAPYAIDLFTKLAKFEPIAPITGEDWEWIEVSDGIQQNVRCGHLFKDKNRFNGQAYDIDGIIFWEWFVDPKTKKKHKSYFTSSDSCVPVKFPYTPKRKYKQRPTTE
jgi:hypothetical protein